MLFNNDNAPAAAEQDDLAEVVARLEKVHADEQKLFFECGGQWAKESASPRELRALADADDIDRQTVLDRIAQQFCENQQEDFWREHGPEDLVDINFENEDKIAFAAGAVAFWNAVVDFRRHGSELGMAA